MDAAGKHTVFFLGGECASVPLRSFLGNELLGLLLI